MCLEAPEKDDSYVRDERAGMVVTLRRRAPRAPGAEGSTRAPIARKPKLGPNRCSYLSWSTIALPNAESFAVGIQAYVCFDALPSTRLDIRRQPDRGVGATVPR
jgi:hypothetical protein